MAAPAPGVAQWLLGDLITTVTHYASTTSATMIGIIAPVAGIMLVMYVGLWGMGIATGQIVEPFSDGAKRIIRISLIVMFALTVGVYQTHVVNFLFNVPSDIAAAIVTAPHGGPAPSGVNTIATIMDQTLHDGMNEGSVIFFEAGKQMSAHNWGTGLLLYVCGGLVDVAVAVIVAIGCAIVFIAFIAMAVLIAIGPLFILMAIFKQTQRFFEAWLGQTLNFAILFLLVAVVMGLVVAMLQHYILDMRTDPPNQLIVDTIKVLGACIAITAVLLQTRSIAASLGGGVALAGQNLAGRLAGAGTRLGRAGFTGSSFTPIATAGSGAEATRQYKAIGRTLALPVSTPYRLARRVWQGSNSARSS